MSTVSGLEIANNVEREWRDRMQAAVLADEALMRQALEALEWSNEYLEAMGKKLFPESKKVQPRSTTWHVQKAIIAIQNRLEGGSNAS